MLFQFLILFCITFLSITDCTENQSESEFCKKPYLVLNSTKLNKESYRNLDRSLTCLLSRGVDGKYIFCLFQNLFK